MRDFVIRHGLVKRKPDPGHHGAGDHFPETVSVSGKSCKPTPAPVPDSTEALS